VVAIPATLRGFRPKRQTCRGTSFSDACEKLLVETALGQDGRREDALETMPYRRAPYRHNSPILWWSHMGLVLASGMAVPW